jgi:2-polyprenyl-3-methyl-5-hydroxy-6-metoxy-1,4-benzoquinol methylase
MGSQRDQLVEDYAKHYARVNSFFDPRTMTEKEFRNHDCTFGELIQNSAPGARILDLGCGTGFLLNWLIRKPGLELVGVDASAGQLEVARSIFSQVEFSCADGLSFLRENPDSFDGIFCTDVLEHIPGTDLCIEWVQAACAALRPGGFFVCRSPNGASLISGYTRYIDLTHERAFTDKSMLQLLDTGGLKDCRILPIRAGSFSGRIRQTMERILHRIVFRVCGQAPAQEFASNLCAVGYRKE